MAGGLGGLYGITNYLSDILSYSRILALSLATGVVGMVMNMLAGMLQGSVLGFVLSLAIYLVGHIFNLALGLLSAYVHDCRLQYIEFTANFTRGGGELFEPLLPSAHSISPWKNSNRSDDLKGGALGTNRLDIQRPLPKDSRLRR